MANSMLTQKLEMKRTVTGPVLKVKPPRKQSPFSAWLIAGLLVLAVCTFAFRKTIFQGANLSISSHLYLQDTIFNTGLPLRELDCISDSTPYTLLIPYQQMIKQGLELHGKIPLWNDMNACGMPIVGDLMAFMFSPFTLLFSICNTHTYSLVLCLYVFAGGLGTLLLARRMGFTPLPAAFAALVYAFNPLLTKYAELPNQPFLVPWITLAALSLGARGFWGAIALGAICGAAPYVMHAECAFAAVCGAWIFLLIETLFSREGSLKEKLKSYFYSLFTAGTAGVFVAAPLLLPFAEYMKNTLSYKASIEWCKNIPWQALLLDLVHPSSGAGSFFGGILVLPLMILGTLKRSRRSTALVVATVCAFWVVAKLFPLDWLSLQRPFNLFMPIYAAPCLLLAFSLLAAEGIARLGKCSLKERLAAAVVLAAAVATPFIFAKMHINTQSWMFDAIPPQIFRAEANTQLAIAILSLIAVIMLPHLSKHIPLRILPARLLPEKLIASLIPSRPTAWQLTALAMIGLNLWSISGAFKSSLPVLKPFNYPTTDVIAFLQQNKGRILAVGNHMLLANTNVVYGINDFRVINPLLPKRYTDFMLQSGGVRQGLSVFVWGAWNLGPELDLASVKYFIMQEPHVALPTDRFKLLKSFPGNMQVYQNLKALPPAFLAYSTVKSESLDESLQLIRSKTFEQDRDVIVESSAASTVLRSTKKISEVAPVQRPDPQTVKLQFKAEAPAMVVLTDSYYPGWTAMLDGKKADIVPVNGMFRGVAVSKGQHELVYEFRSTSLETGIKILIGGIAILALIGLVQIARLFGLRSLQEGGAPR